MRTIMLLFILLPAFRVEGTACTIFIGSNDQSTFVGNNEDYTPSVNTFLWIRPRQQGRYGYIFWGFEEKYPEGGMNDKGLFMDAAALSQKIVLERNPLKPDFNGYLTETILRQCSTVEEVITLVKKYNLTWQEKAQILVADRSGDYAIIHANYIVRKTTSIFVLTNYSLRDPAAKDFSCWRRNTAYKYLSGPDLSVAQFREILSKTAQTEPDNATVYSQVCDLRKGIIYLYRLHDFSVADTINLSALLLDRKSVV